MAKRCTRCGNFLMDDERFCTRCGENVSAVPTMPAAAPDGTYNSGASPTGNTAQQNSYSSTAQQNTYSNPRPYNTYTAYQQAQDDMTLGKWVATIIVTTFFGIISLIFLFIWGFGDGPESRKNYCKAMLIVDAISIALVIILYIFIFAAIFSNADSFVNEFRDAYQEYGQDAAVALAALFG